MIIDNYTGYRLDGIKRSKNVLLSVLKQAGSTLIRGASVRCPFCDDGNPSGGVYETEGGVYKYKCHKCGKQGSVIDVISWSDGIEPEEVIKKLQPEEGRLYKKPKVYPTIENIRDAILRTPGVNSIESIYKYTSPITQQVDMIVFRCISDNGKTFRPARPVDGGYVMESHKAPRPIYNRTRVNDSLKIVVVEGEKCVHALASVGIVATTSPGGYANAKYADWTPLSNKDVVLWRDNDEAGMKYINDVEEKLNMLDQPPRISIIDPADLDLQEKEDAADYILQMSSLYTDKQTLISEAYKVFDCAKTKSVAGKLHDHYRSIIEGKCRTVPFPWSSICKTRALLPGTVTIICGSPGASKSLMLLQCISYWMETGVKCVVCELEKDRRYHLRRAHAQVAENSMLTDNDWVEANPDLVIESYSEHEAYLSSLGHCIYDGQEATTTYEDMAAWVEEKAKHGNRIIAIDPITILDAQKESFRGQQKFMQLMNDRVIKKYPDCSIVIIIHPKKGALFPSLDDVAGSTAFGRFVDTSIWVDIHDEKVSSVRTSCGTIEVSHNRTVHVLKARNGAGGGMQIAYQFNSDDLKMKEFGFIVKKQKYDM